VRDVEQLRDVERPKGAERRRSGGTTAHRSVDFRRAPTGCRDGRLSIEGRSVVPEAADVGLAPRRDGRHRSRHGHYQVRLFARRRRIRRKVHDGRPQGLCVNAQLYVHCLSIFSCTEHQSPHWIDNTKAKSREARPFEPQPRCAQSSKRGCLPRRGLSERLVEYKDTNARPAQAWSPTVVVALCAEGLPCTILYLSDTQGRKR